MFAKASIGACMLAAALCAAGCKNGPMANNSLALQNQVEELRRQQMELARRDDELQNRAGSLDYDNEQLGSLLAQEQQRSRLLDQQLAATQEQLRSTAGELADAREKKDEIEQRAKAMVASMQRTRPSFQANSSLAGQVDALRLPGLEVRQDGDVIRIELPVDELFETGAGRLKYDAATTLDAVSAEISRNFPGQLIGVEGHTAAGAATGFQAASGHELSLQQATAVFQFLAGRGRISPAQISVAGHGPNHPVVSNATPEGQRRNRRVEIVIYPEQLAR